MHSSAYYWGVWNVDSSEDFDEWFCSLDEDSKESVYSRVLLLREFGPQLPRPYSDVIHGASRHNLKELRCQSEKHVLRVSYYFDPNRNAFLLIGGDKKGKDQKKFYKDLISESEMIIERHETEILGKQ